MRILIATPCYGGMVTSSFMLSFLGVASAAQQEGVAIGFYTVSNESLIPRGRNFIATEFLSMNPSFDKLLFIDADIKFSWEDVKKLLGSNEQIVGGTYPKKTLPIDLSYNPLPEHSDKYFPLGSRTLTEHKAFAEAEAGSNGEVEVVHLLTGFLMIDRSVLEALKEKTQSYSSHDLITGVSKTYYDFFPAGVRDGLYRSEDWGFCELARENGFCPTLQTEVILDHVGSFAYSGKS